MTSHHVRPWQVLMKKSKIVAQTVHVLVTLEKIGSLGYGHQSFLQLLTSGKNGMNGSLAVRHVEELSHKQGKGTVTSHPVMPWQALLRKSRIVAQMMHAQVVVDLWAIFTQAYS